jgi:peptidylprolyl isomerase
MASKKERIFAGVGALLFFVTSFSLTALVLWSMHQQNQDNAQQAKAEKTVCSTTPKPDPSHINEKEKGTTLQGSSMPDFTPCTVDKLKTIDITTGTGPEVKESDTVTVDYTGAVTLTGIIFQSSLDTGQPATFPLNGVIKGWTLGIPGMKVGGKRRLLIPAALAYGASPPQSSGIPANADLVFDVTLKKIGS